MYDMIYLSVDRVQFRKLGEDLPGEQDNDDEMSLFACLLLDLSSGRFSSCVEFFAMMVVACVRCASKCINRACCFG